MTLADHDKMLIDTLLAAKFVEDREGHSLSISFAHLRGSVWFSDGVMYWNAGDKGGEKRVDQQDIDRSAGSLLNYGRTAVRNELERTAKKVLAEARARL